MNNITVPEDRVFGGAVRFLRVDINLQIVFIDDQKIMPVPFITRFPRKKYVCSEIGIKNIRPI